MHLHHDEVANLSDSSYIIEPFARQISFIQASDDTIYNRSNNDTIFMTLSTQNTIVDQAQGMHLKLGSFSPLTTIAGFQDDRRACPATGWCWARRCMDRSWRVSPAITTCVWSSSICMPSYPSFPRAEASNIVVSVAAVTCCILMLGWAISSTC